MAALAAPIPPPPTPHRPFPPPHPNPSPAQTHTHLCGQQVECAAVQADHPHGRQAIWVGGPRQRHGAAQPQVQDHREHGT